MRCLVYIDLNMVLNMVRAGVVDDPSKWPHGGYNEIRAPRRKNIIIAYERNRELDKCIMSWAQWATQEIRCWLSRSCSFCRVKRIMFAELLQKPCVI